MKKREILRQDWESLCNKCGLCCFEKIEDEHGTIFFTSTPCRYLDVVTRECKIYPRRFEIYPECMQLTETLVRELSWLHDECGYRKALGIRNTGKPGRRKV
ncbi:MAG: YcgN family cysteine cluster protein [Geobacteraceae bacterium]|nr:YcgN family cysteine cluster protein [Geobacteraceae bacterium]